MTNWDMDESGNKKFVHEGWTVRIWSSEWKGSRIVVDAPHAGEEVAVDYDGIWVRGEDGRGSWEGPSPQSFTIPWAVVGAIIEARAIVG
jgi:hypothetical protein